MSRPGEPLGRRVEARGLARGGERDERRRRRRVREQAVERVGQPERLAQPPDDDALELGPDRRRPPQHRVLAERGREELAEHPGAGRARREVGEEARVLPVGRVREHQAIDVREDRVHRLRARPAPRPAGAARWTRARSRGTPRTAPRRGGSPRSGRRRRGPRPGTPPGPCRCDPSAGPRPGARRLAGKRRSHGIAHGGEDRRHLAAEEDQGDEENSAMIGMIRREDRGR